MPKSKTKLKVVKLDDKRPLGDDEQINLVRDKVLDLFDEIHEKVTIPNTIIAMQVLVTDCTKQHSSIKYVIRYY
jgi:hypothetical protein